MSRKLTVEDVRDELQVGRDLAYSIAREIGDKEGRFWVVRDDVLKAYIDGITPSKIADKWADEVVSTMPRTTFGYKEGRIYFVSDGKSVKIGFTTKRPMARTLSLQTSNAVKLELLGSFYGCLLQERHLHAALECERVRGEWFRKAHKVEALMKRLRIR